MTSIRPAALPTPTALDNERAVERRMVELAVGGNAQAFREMVERHHRGIFSMVLRMIGDHAECEDLVQETFAKAYRSLSDYDPTYRLSTWLYRIALNTCRDHMKSPRRRERPGSGVFPSSTVLLAAEAPTPDHAVADAQRAERVRAAIDRLSPSYREVIVLKDLQDLSYEEIHQIVGSPVTALKIRVVRARAKLRQLLEAEGIR